YLIAGAGYTLLVVYLLLVIWMGYENIPILSDGKIADTSGAFTTAILRGNDTSAPVPRKEHCICSNRTN
ncbi:MAG TPA: hypothetical protein QGG11_04115, partial [Candidatus Poseidoniia archaeon]|nr:hypothetical protein [Candidatus Poseidoniia archaeon]